MPSTVRILDDPRGAIVDYVPEFLDPGERRALRGELEQASAGFDRDRVVILGKAVDSPRLVRAFGDDALHYRYAGVDRETAPWLPRLRAVRDRLVALAGHPFNDALVNWYRDGDDYIGRHADKEADLVPEASIASVSLGAARPFLLRDRAGGEAREVVLADGSLLWMRGTTQQHFKHSLPRRRAITEPRFNITFREIVAAPGRR